MFQNLSTLWLFVYGTGAVCVGLASFYWKATFYKFKLYTQALQHFILSSDNKWKVSDVRDPASLAPTGPWEKRRVMFVRHGESQWNETFNRGFNPIFFIPRVVYALLYEFYLLLKGVRDSWFYDSSLSHIGIQQASALRKAVLEGTRDAQHPLHILGGKSKSPSVIVSSPLRRALSTAIYGMYERLDQDEEKIVMLPALQEMSRNMDTLPLTPPHAKPVASWVEAAQTNVNIPRMYENRIDVGLYTGNKSVKCTGLSRLMAFNKWAFTRPTDEVIIVAGHSLWFRAFFKTFLPHQSTHKSKTKKMQNCAVISFDLLSTKDENGIVCYKVDESSIIESHLGFEK